MITAQHYLQTRDAHFDLVAGVGGLLRRQQIRQHTRAKAATPAPKPKSRIRKKPLNYRGVVSGVMRWKVKQ
jgi:hypothetical protein